MRSLMIAALVFFASPAAAADEMTIAVFTKNSTNPAYEAFRIASDQIALDRRKNRPFRPEAARQCR
jgi:ribose transport system substrate-binding protein